ncbi:MAG: methyltransferase domain-containing protein [Bacteroidetes bacterium]|nr:methyltransferase domain-containing protein [Bacteroidota bacterium]
MLNQIANSSGDKQRLNKQVVISGLPVKNAKRQSNIKKVTGEHVVFLDGIKQLITDNTKKYHLVDIGCGSGDSLIAIADWARENHYNVHLTGVDIDKKAISCLNHRTEGYPEIIGVNADFQDFLDRTNNIDIVHSSLFCHHFSDEEFFKLFFYLRQHVNIGFIMNDLHRSWLAFICAWTMARIFKVGFKIGNNGPQSVLKGYKAFELKELLLYARIMNYSLKRTWYFRYSVVGKTNKNDAWAA